MPRLGIVGRDSRTQVPAEPPWKRSSIHPCSQAPAASQGPRAACESCCSSALLPSPPACLQTERLRATAWEAARWDLVRLEAPASPRSVLGSLPKAKAGTVVD